MLGCGDWWSFTTYKSIREIRHWNDEMMKKPMIKRIWFRFIPKVLRLRSGHFHFDVLHGVLCSQWRCHALYDPQGSSESKLPLIIYSLDVFFLNNFYLIFSTWCSKCLQQVPRFISYSPKQNVRQNWKLFNIKLFVMFHYIDCNVNWGHGLKEPQ